MKRLLFISLLCLISLSVLAQKVTINVSKTKNAGATGWQIIDDQNITIISGTDNLQNDSVTFSLDANKYYFLKISIAEITNAYAVLYTLRLNDEPLLLINSDIGKGDHLFPFFTGIKTLNAKITGGTDALISDFPWQVFLISGSQTCGGTIINKDWIVTAAHCTKNGTGPTPASDMSVIAGANNPRLNPNAGGIYSVREVIVNEGFNDQTLLNDIALLRLTEPIVFANATPIKLITADDVAAGAIVPGVMSWVTGWGLTNVNPNNLPTALQKVQLPIVSNAQASTVWGSSIVATDLMAGFLNGNKDACNGDSGGPLVVQVLGEYKLAGIVSWGSSNCNTYGAYTRVSDFETWIQTKTGITRDFKPAAPLGDSIICQGTVSSQYSVSPIVGVTAYEWRVFPSNAGVISANSQNASVLWNISYTGSAAIILRVTINGKVSDWSRLDANLALNTTLLSQSGDITICANQPVTLNVNIEGYNLSYKWFKNGQIVQSGPSSKLSFSNAKADDSGNYTCVITGSCGTIESKIINLTVYPLTRITNITQNVEVPFQNDLTLKVDAIGHDLVYQWQKDGTVIANSNTSGLFLANMNASDIGIYKVTVKGTCGVVISDTIYVYVKRANFSTEPEVFLWPSVTSHEFTLALSKDAFYNVRIFSTMGKKVRELINCRYQTRINISRLARGVYIVEVYNRDFRKSIKVIKE